MKPYEHARHQLEDSWRQVGGYMSQAMQDVATELGGEDFAVLVAEAAITEHDSPLPNPHALEVLQDRFPGSAEQVIDRMERLQTEAHQRDIAELHKHKFRRYGRALLYGFASIGEGMASIGGGMSQIGLAARSRSSKTAGPSSEG